MIQETLQDMWSAAAQKRREDEQPVTYGDVFGNFLAEGKNLPAYLQESGAPAFLSSFLMGAGMSLTLAFVKLSGYKPMIRLELITY